MFRFYLAQFIGFILCAFFNKHIKSGKILSIYFHNPSVFLFEKCIKYLFNKGYSFISTSDLNNIIRQKEIIQKKLVVVTFDDGWRGNLKLLPIIEKYKVYSTFFITTDAVLNGNFWWEYADYINKYSDVKYNTVEKLKKVNNIERCKVIELLIKKVCLNRSAMTKQELINLSKSPFVTIGSHTVNHPITVKCGNVQLFEEYFRSKKILETWIKKPICSFAYPNGDYNKRDIEILKEVGYNNAFTTRYGKISHSSEVYEFERCSINSNGSFYENKAKIFGIWQRFL